MAQESFESQDSLAASMARTAETYDAVPYLSLPFARLHPSRIAAVATVLGLNPCPVGRARILEIGCATGGHLIPIAACHPQAEVVGLDISAKQIELGQARIARLGLGNITLQARSLTELGEADGHFDYIICHGVYSWIPEGLRSELMRVIGERLAPAGVAIVSFNVLPGWRLYQVVRDSMILHAGGKESHEDRTAWTRHLFEVMEKHAHTSTTYGQVWRKEAPRMSALPDFYLAHELFEDNNLPCTFTDFMAMADRHGLAYLAETRFAANIPENNGPELAAIARVFGQNEPVRTEQYIDIVTGRSFRESLLIRADQAATVHRQLDPERLADLHVTMTAGATLQDKDDGSVVLTYDTTEMELRDRGLVEALRQVLARRPATTALADLVPTTDWGADWRDEYLRLILKLFCNGGVDLRTDPILCTPKASRNPKAWTLAVDDALQNHKDTATLCQMLYELTPFGRFLLPLLDGTRSREALFEAVHMQALEGETTVSDASGPVTDPERLRDLCQTLLDRQLTSFAQAGLLVS
jgi:SAM-dependent methyltransferase